MNLTSKIYRKNTIARKFVVYIVLFSSFVTLFTTLFQIYNDYQISIKDVRNNLIQIQNSYQKSLRDSLWNFNHDQIALQLEGILSMPNIEYVEIFHNDKSLLSIGAKHSKYIVDVEYPLARSHKNKIVQLGKIRIITSLESIYSRLIKKSMVILISNAIKTFIVAGFIFLLFYKLVGRHLKILAQYLQKLNLKENTDPSEILKDRKNDNMDELDLVVSAINVMHANLSELFKEVQEGEEKFRGLVESSSDWIWEVNKEGVYTYASPQVETVLGYKPEELADKTPFDLMPPDEAEQKKTIFNKLIEAGRPIITLENVCLPRMAT